MTRREWIAGAVVLASGFPLRAANGALAVASLDHVNLHVPDVQRTADFYVKLFGTVVSRTASAPAKPGSARSVIWFLRLGENVLAISTAGAGEKPGVDHYCFAIDDFRGEEVRPKLAGLNEMNPTAPPGNLWLRDPDGYVIQLNGGDKGDTPGRAVGAVLIDPPAGTKREPAFRVKAITALMLPVADRNASEAYYRNALGTDAEPTTKYAFRAGLSQLVLTTASAGLRLRMSVEGFSAPAAMTKLRALGIAEAKQEKGTVVFRDPDGTEIQLEP